MPRIGFLTRLFLVSPQSHGGQGYRCRSRARGSSGSSSFFSAVFSFHLIRVQMLVGEQSHDLTLDLESYSRQQRAIITGSALMFQLPYHCLRNASSTPSSELLRVQPAVIRFQFPQFYTSTTTTFTTRRDWPHRLCLSASDGCASETLKG